MLKPKARQFLWDDNAADVYAELQKRVTPDVVTDQTSARSAAWLFTQGWTLDDHSEAGKHPSGTVAAAKESMAAGARYAVPQKEGAAVLDYGNNIHQWLNAGVDNAFDFPVCTGIHSSATPAKALAHSAGRAATRKIFTKLTRKSKSSARTTSIHNWLDMKERNSFQWRRTYLLDKTERPCPHCSRV